MSENLRVHGEWSLVPLLCWFKFFLALIAKCGVRCRLFIHVLAFHGMCVCVCVCVLVIAEDSAS